MTKNQQNRNQYLDQIEFLFRRHLSKLPRIIYASNDDAQMAGLLLLKGLLQCLAHTRLKTVLSINDTLDQFMGILLGMCELTRPECLLQNEYSTRDIIGADESANRQQWRESKNLTNESVLDCVPKICEILGRSNSADILFAYAMDLFVQNTIKCNDVLVFLQLLLNGGGWGETHRLRACLEEILRPIHWDLDEQASRHTQMKMAEVSIHLFRIVFDYFLFLYLVWSK